ncbi:MAG: hypothetical protein E6H40_03910, partial [Betaproteobacteria bacterium]
YVTGVTQSADFTAGCTAPCTVLNGTLIRGGTNRFAVDAFVTKLNATGTALVYSTYLGGSGSDAGYGIAVDAAGAAYVTGTTGSTDFTAGCTARCTVLNGTLNRGGTNRFAVDAFVTKLNATGTALVYSTYLGGSGSDAGYGIAVDAAGAAYVTGTTSSTDFTAGCTAPCTVLEGTFGGVQDAFVTKINAAGTALVYSTYLGGSNDDVGLGIAVHAAGAARCGRGRSSRCSRSTAYVTGITWSTDFTAGCTAPCTLLDASLGGFDNAFVAKIADITSPPDEQCPPSGEGDCE